MQFIHYTRHYHQHALAPCHNILYRYINANMQILCEYNVLKQSRCIKLSVVLIDQQIPVRNPTDWLTDVRLCPTWLVVSGYFITTTIRHRKQCRSYWRYSLYWRYFSQPICSFCMENQTRHIKTKQYNKNC